MTSLYNYLLQLGDNALILSHRLGEWCGHGPVLEQDIALTNIALDLLGQSRMLYSYAAELEGKGRSEDDIAYFRDAHAFRNVLLVEQPNVDFAYTIMRQFLYDAYAMPLYQSLTKSSDTHLAAIAEKALKETTYHLRFSSDWVLRLGDGTALSREKMEHALADLWMFTAELTQPNEVETDLAKQGIAPDFGALKAAWSSKVKQVLTEATIGMPAENAWMQHGGKNGVHTEHLGYILAEMQYLQRTYPGSTW
jgi:ring-1,2-phenylacetyl-CoA epoxidase subunit PaaC